VRHRPSGDLRGSRRPGGAAELLISLGPRLCHVRREEWAEGCAAVELFAVLEAARTPLEVDGTLKAASGAGRACLVGCVVDADPDAQMAFGKAQRLMVGRAGWTM
jgi:hypothetical protein